MFRPTVLLLFACLAGCGDRTAASGLATGEVPSADSVANHYEVRGAGESTLVLVHGWTNSRAIWGKHPETLGRTHRVVTLDVAGHGTSGANRRTWTLNAFGEDVEAVVERLELEQVVLVGFSMGAAWCWKPRSASDRVVGVVFVDNHEKFGFHAHASRAEQMKATFRANWGDRELLRSFGSIPDGPESVIDYALEMMGDEPWEHWFDIFDAYGVWLASELKPTLRRLQVPIAAINRPHPPTDVEAMRRYVPSFHADFIDGLGHAGILLWRVEEFDTKLLGDVERFAAVARLEGTE